MIITTLPIRSLLFPAKKNKMKRMLIIAIVLMVQLLHSTATATDERITTYYWDGGWIEHASWTTSTLGEDLTIDIDAWNWEPDFSPLNVKFDNVITSEGLVDDFDDGIIDSSIWESYIPIDPTSVTETGGVLEIDIPGGPSSSDPDQCQVGGVITKDFVLHGNFDVQVDFSVNPEYHTTPNTNAKLFLTDQSGNSVEISIRSDCYLSVDLPLGSWIMKEMTPTDHLNGKLRITRTEITGIVEVDIDIKPGSETNPINQGSNGLIPVAILSSDNFVATTVIPASVLLGSAEVAVRGNGKLMAHEEDVNGDDLTDLVIQVETQAAGSWESGYIELTAETTEGLSIVGYDEIVIVPPE